MDRSNATPTGNLHVITQVTETGIGDGPITSTLDYSGALHEQPLRIVGMEWGTALLALITCLLFAVAVVAMTGSVLTAGLATAGIVAGLVMTLRILRFPR
ncbi:hypothetical protein [Nocardia sp. NBC_00416]|uniref:hypothetical protein n=1 Tax=Nocardia sp. NBC_00416 TaxID=2975991 RepID=UPI002E1C8C19